MEIMNVEKILTPWELRNLQVNHHRTDILKHYQEIYPHLLKNRQEYKKALASQIKPKYKDIHKGMIIKLLENEKKEIGFELRHFKTPMYRSDIKKQIKNINNKVAILRSSMIDINFCREYKKLLKSKIFRLDRDLLKLYLKLNENEDQMTTYVEHKYRILDNLKNRQEAFTKLEGKMFLENERMRKKLIDMLFERATFNKLWNKMNTRLNKDKWYLIDMFEQAMLTFDSSKAVYNMMQNVDKKFKRNEYELIMSLFGSEDVYDRITDGQGDLKDEEEKRKIDIYNILRKIELDKDACKFIKMKTNFRESIDIEPLRYRQRREIIKEWYKTAYETYKMALEEAIPYEKGNVDDAIKRCDEQESFRYSYYIYMNDINYRVVNLNNKIDDLYLQIGILRDAATKKINVSLLKLKSIRQQYEEEKRTTNEKLQNKNEATNRLENIFNGLYDIITKTNCDLSSFQYYLGDYSKITVFNVRRFLKALENQLNIIIFCLNVHRRRTDKGVRHVRSEYVNQPTPLQDIVLVDQCAECAERDDVIYDFGPAELMTMNEIRFNMQKKVKLPNMRERLHTISQCTLPRSRLIRPRRYFNNLLSLL